MNLKQPATVFLYDLLIVPVSWFFACLLRYNFDITAMQFLQASYIFGILFPIQLVFYFYFGLYRGIWRFASVPDLIRIIKTVVCSSALTIVLIFIFAREVDFSRSVFLFYALLSISFLGGARLSYRYFIEHAHLKNAHQRVLIIGAGNAGEGLVRDLFRDHVGRYLPVAFVDDDLHKSNKEIHGIRVVGKCKDLPSIVKKYEINLIFIAIPSVPTEQMQHLIDLCMQTHLPFKTLPHLSEMTNGVVRAMDVREVAVEDLLGREQVALDRDKIAARSNGKTALVSGGGGSIGSELCRQIAGLNSHLKQLIVVERSEFNLYQLQQEMMERYPDLNFVAYLGSVTDQQFLERIFAVHQPQVVFHAAAYKHVPILEEQIHNAIYNNVWGTKILAEVAIAHGVSKFICISTDKAVRPTNIMGATKRLAEILCQNFNRMGKTKFAVVRFGNVLGSSGSVIPLFKKQLAAGKPLTVTHPAITRFFMTITEAAQLILEACAISQGGEIYVLDMGKPVKISYLAEQLIKLSGKTLGVDAEIVYTGLRPGEKLHEELFYATEKVNPTCHPKILQAESEVTAPFDWSCFETLLKSEEHTLRAQLKELVPEYQSEG